MKTVVVLVVVFCNAQSEEEVGTVKKGNNYLNFWKTLSEKLFSSIFFFSTFSNKSIKIIIKKNRLACELVALKRVISSEVSHLESKFKLAK